ncbi:hypothetical protein Tco_0574310 [Tanacetum coccineum]
MKWVLCVQWLRLAVTGLGLGLQSLHSLCQLHTNGLLKLIEGPFGLHSLHNYTIGLSRPIRWVKIASNSILQFRLRFDCFCSRGGGGGSVDLVSVVSVTLEGTSADANSASASGNKKQAGLSTQDISNSNLFDVLNSIKNDYDLGTNRGSSKLAEKGSNSDGKLMLVDDDGKPLKKVDYLVNADSDSEAEEVFNETVGFMASTSSKVYNHSKSDSGVESKSMYEQWRETYVKHRYDDEDFDDCGLIDASLKFVNAFDISLHGQLR